MRKQEWADISHPEPAIHPSGKSAARRKPSRKELLLFVRAGAFSPSWEGNEVRPSEEVRPIS